MKKQSKYVDHDGWPALKKRLEKEIKLNESFFDPTELDLPSVQDAFVLLEFLDRLKPPVRVVFCQVAYGMLFKHYPVIKLKVSEAVFESWMITHTVEDLKQLIGYKNER